MKMVVELKDCVQEDGKLYLVFEFLDKDLKKYMESCSGLLSPILVKSLPLSSQPWTRFLSCPRCHAS